MVVTMTSRQHPLYIFYDSQKWLPLLLIPILRAVFSPRDAVYILLASLRDVGIALALLAYSSAKWNRARYRLHNGITVRQGLFLPRTLHILANDAASIEVERSPLMALVRARRVRINTAGLRRRSDATLYLSAAQARLLLNTGRRRVPLRYAARPWPVTVMSASSSNAAVGLLTLAPIARRAASLLGSRFSEEVYGLAGRFLSLGLPPLLETLANILVVGWAFAFMRSWLRYAGFYAQREGAQLHLVSGLITRRDVCIDCQKIIALELRQTLFMRLFALYTVVITAAGYGREKGARPVLVPAARARELSTALNTLLSDYPICSSSLRPKRTALFSYIWLPLLMLCGSILPFWLGGVWSVAGLLWLFGSLWWLVIRCAGFFRSGFGVGNGAVTLRYARGLALYEVHVPAEVADCILLTRSPWQRRSGACTVEVRCFGEKRRRHRVRALPYEQARALVERLLTPPQE